VDPHAKKGWHVHLIRSNVGCEAKGNSVRCVPKNKRTALTISERVGRDAR
jgi:hypothetical protein